MAESLVGASVVYRTLNLTMTMTVSHCGLALDIHSTTKDITSGLSAVTNSPRVEHPQQSAAGVPAVA